MNQNHCAFRVRLIDRLSHTVHLGKVAACTGTVGHRRALRLNLHKDVETRIAYVSKGIESTNSNWAYRPITFLSVQTSHYIGMW